VLSGCVPAPSAEASLGGVDLVVYVADEPEEWGRGLQGYDELGPGEGILFDYGQAETRTFAMKDVTFAIDVVFIGEDGNVSAIEPLFPGDTRLATSPGPSAYVLELPQGWAEEQGVEVGSTFELTDPPVE